MPVRPPVTFDGSLFERRLDAVARGVLREDTSNLWSDDQHALPNLVRSAVLVPLRFDELDEDNRYIVFALVDHILEQLRRDYVRRVPKDDLPEHRSLKVNYPVAYVASPELWEEIVTLARVQGSDGAPVLNRAAAVLGRFLREASGSGRLTKGDELELLLEHAEDYREDLARTLRRRPVLDEADLDSDDMHAFLCAFETCFHG